MESSFVKTVEYLKYLDKIINDSELEMSKEEKIIYIIQNIILTSENNCGSIIFTKEGENYKVSEIQRASYGRHFIGEFVKLDLIIKECENLNIICEFKKISIGSHKEDYELSFYIDIKKQKIKRK